MDFNGLIGQAKSAPPTASHGMPPQFQHASALQAPQAGGGILQTIVATLQKLNPQQLQAVARFLMQLIQQSQASAGPVSPAGPTAPSVPPTAGV